MAEEERPVSEIEEQVKKKFKRRQETVASWFASIGFIAVVWILWFTADPSARTNPTLLLILSVAIGLARIFDIAKLMLKEAQEREIQYRYEFEKGKREDNTRLVRLSDDGELEDLPDTEWEANQLKQST